MWADSSGYAASFIEGVLLIWRGVQTATSQEDQTAFRHKPGNASEPPKPCFCRQVRARSGMLNSLGGGQQ